MSKIKKVLAMLLALAMVMGTTLTAFAAPQKPTDADVSTITVSGIEKGATVKAYQIVKATYNDSGLTGYAKVNDEDGIADIYKPTPAEITALASKYRGTGGAELTYAPEVDAYKLTANAGTYLVLVEAANSAKIYNPMIVSIAYMTGESVSGNLNELIPGEVNAASDWNLNGVEAYAKSSDVTIEKEADVTTQNLGGIVKYDVTTTVPEYSAEYTTVKFDVTDTLTHLTLKVDKDHPFTVEGADKDAYTVTGNTNGSTTYMISFKSDWIKENGAQPIKITYYAEMTGDAVNTDAHTNKVVLDYTNRPGEHTGSKEDIEKVYTFDIDGNLTGDILNKVAPGQTEGSTIPLADAEFTLYTDETCKTQYVNTKHPTGKATAVTTSEGKINITGLAAGTYYLKETKAPNGYSLNDTVYKIVITATIEKEELKSWNIVVTNVATGENLSNDFVVAQNGSVTPTMNPTNILNTTLSTLPSTGGIGTTVFTIGGCLIMIAAAGMFFASRRKSSNK